MPAVITSPGFTGLTPSGVPANSNKIDRDNKWKQRKVNDK